MTKNKIIILIAGLPVFGCSRNLIMLLIFLKSGLAEAQTWQWARTVDGSGDGYSMTKGMKFFIIKFGLVAILTFLIVGCNKKPQADFTTDKEKYTAGDIIKLTNKSLHAKTYHWLFPNFSTSTEKNSEYHLSPNLDDGACKIMLEADRGNEGSIITKTISVESQKGQLTVWTSDTISSRDFIKMQVYVNGFAGVITSRYDSDPGCGASGCVTLTLKVGRYPVWVSNGFNTRQDTVTISQNSCVTFELPKK